MAVQVDRSDSKKAPMDFKFKVLEMYKLYIYKT